MKRCDDCNLSFETDKRFCAKCGKELIKIKLDNQNSLEKPFNPNVEYHKYISKSKLTILGISVIGLLGIYYSYNYYVVHIKTESIVDSERIRKTLENREVTGDTDAPYNFSDDESSYVDNIYGKFPQGSKNILNSYDLSNLSRYDLKIMRNEIFARHGYIFKSKDMIEYFSNQNWYSPQYNDVNGFLTELEKNNIELIKKYE